MVMLARALIGFGIAITLWVWLYESTNAFAWATLGDFLEEVVFQSMLAAPWIILLILHLKRINNWGVVISAIPMALFEVMAYHTTFINPQGSTAALIYAVKPFYQLLFMAVGLLVGWVISKGVRRA